MFKKAFLYFGISLLIYLLELLIFNLFIEFTNYDILILNYVIRLFACVFAAVIYKLYLFKDVKNFVFLYSLTALVVPVIATSFLYFFTLIMNYPILYLKFSSDVCASVLGYVLLQTAASLKPRRR